VTLALNWLVAILKIIFGLATRCMVIVADGAHSFSDGTSNIVGLVAIYFSGQPADKNHPYGHQKYETLASAAIAFLLFVVSFGIFKESVHGFIHPKNPEVNGASFAIMVFTLIVNVFVVWYERGEGKRLTSDFLISDSWHTLTDIFVTLSVFVALFAIYCKVPRMDSIFSLLIAVVIVVTAISILKRSSDVLCDKAVLDTTQIERIVRAVKGVRDCHEIRTRGRVDDVYVDLHVLVDNNMTVALSHDLANQIETNIKSQIPGVHDVVVHVEPVSHEHRSY
jgi:cation diffusion facilitator family transporter